MFKQDIINSVTKFVCAHGENINDVIVSHSGACVLHGITRTTKDVDLYVTDEIWNKHIELGFIPVVKPDDILTIQATPDISIRTNVEQAWDDAGVCQNILYQCAHNVIHDYISLNRKKDYKKIAKLQKIVE